MLFFPEIAFKFNDFFELIDFCLFKDVLIEAPDFFTFFALMETPVMAVWIDIIEPFIRGSFNDRKTNVWRRKARIVKGGGQWIRIKNYHLL